MSTENGSGHIECESLRKVFYDGRSRTEIVALGNFTLDIKAGELITIVGPSGCGKTTLLNIAAGFERHTAGRILIDGQPVAGPGPDRGVVFQEYALFPWLRVTQNVAYGLAERGMRKNEAHELAESWLERVGLEGFGHQYPHELSGGMRQRVALIRVLANDPRILLMDEPFAALDALTRGILQKELEILWEETRKTVIFVTHNVEEAIYLGDRMVIMSARPSSIKAVVPINLPRPRDATTGEFNEHRRFAAEQLIQEQQTSFTARRRVQ
jgi:ABC-type nitrate/sulfonate/bicarbonate transport system ATPase subunit